MEGYYKVIRIWRASTDKPVEVVPGAFVELDLSRRENHPDWQGWVWCKAEDKEGWVPEQILEFQAGSSGAGARVTCHYTARELSVDEGDVVTIIEMLNGWAWVENVSNQEQGWVPLQNLLQQNK